MNDWTDQAGELVAAIRRLDDDRLGEMSRRFNRAAADSIRAHGHFEHLADLDPIVRVEMVLGNLFHNEQIRRDNTLWALEADLNGGHRVEVAGGNEWGTYAAVCVPRPDADNWCWNGPDRLTVEDAVADGERHHPGYEISINV